MFNEALAEKCKGIVVRLLWGIFVVGLGLVVAGFFVIAHFEERVEEINTHGEAVLVRCYREAVCEEEWANEVYRRFPNAEAIADIRAYVNLPILTDVWVKDEEGWNVIRIIHGHPDHLSVSVSSMKDGPVNGFKQVVVLSDE